MNALLLASICFSFALASEFDSTWQEYKDLHGKVYDEVQDEVRRAIYVENMEKVVNHNLEAARGLHSFTLGPNKYADLTNEEYRQQLSFPFVSTKAGRFNTSNVGVPDTVDWRDSGFVPQVHDQGQCGDPSIIATMDSLEFQEKNIFKSLFSLSTEQVLDCCTDCCTDTCSCGLYADYIQCLVQLGGIESEASYPSGKCGPCQYDPKKAAMKVTDEVQVVSGSEIGLMEAVAYSGIAVAGIDASSFSFQLYQGGVYDEPDCSSTLLDHIIVVVGYGNDNGQDYWLVKNSWGTAWGEEGYIRMSRNKKNQCGIATLATIPVTAKV